MLKLNSILLFSEAPKKLVVFYRQIFSPCWRRTVSTTTCSQRSPRVEFQYAVTLRDARVFGRLFNTEAFMISP